MSDYFWGMIRIGGPVPDKLVPEFRQQLHAAGLADLGTDLASLADYLEDDVLSFEDDQAYYGGFTDLECWLYKNGIEFDRRSAGYCDFSPCLMSYRPSIGMKEWMLDHSGNKVVGFDDLIRWAANAPNLPHFIKELEELAGSDMLALQPFVGTANPTVQLTADELKRKNTDPAAANCARCGDALTDHGLGPMYKHCPKCEP